MDFPVKKNINILALGAESAGVFAIYENGSVFVSENFGDLLEEDNFLKFKKAVLEYFPPKADQPRAGKKEKIKPDIILTDLHPEYKTTIFSEELFKKFGAKNIKVQHHIAHIFSAVGDSLAIGKWPIANSKLPGEFFGIAVDGTGYGLDGNIWGGEALQLQITNSKWQMAKIERIGSLEEQIMIGGDLAVREPARMLIAILARIMNQESRIMNKKLGIIKIKEDIYEYVKKYYSRNEFEALFNQMEQDFNCQTTTSTGRILDAAAVLLGFAGNERNFKHEATKKLEENSSEPYEDIESRIMNHESRQILNTTYLFEYLLKNIHKDKKRLAATAQLYIAKGLYEIIKPFAICHLPVAIRHKPFAIFAAGGLSNNKIISSYLEKQGVYLAKKIPRGDEGISFGQIIYYLLNKK